LAGIMASSASSGDFTAYQTADGRSNGGSSPGIRDESGGDSADDRAGGLALADVRIRRARGECQNRNNECGNE
jgi:hypothetical protein